MASSTASEERSRVFAVAIKLCLIAGLTQGALSFVFAAPLSSALGAVGELAVPSASYLSWRALGLPFFQVRARAKRARRKRSCCTCRLRERAKRVQRRRCGSRRCCARHAAHASAARAQRGGCCSRECCALSKGRMLLSSLLLLFALLLLMPRPPTHPPPLPPHPNPSRSCWRLARRPASPLATR
jgi:hypothetical protein